MINKAKLQRRSLNRFTYNSNPRWCFLTTVLLDDSYADTIEWGIALAAVVVSIAIAENYINLANNYYADYSVMRNFYYNTFQQQGELPFTNETFGLAFYAPDYIGVNNVGYLPPGAWYLFNPELVSRTANITATQGRYGSRYSAPLEVAGSAPMDVASITDDWNSYMNRYEEHKRDVFNARWWASRMDALSYGNKEAAMTERGLATSFAVFDNASGELESNINSIGNGLASYRNYVNTVKDLSKDFDNVPFEQRSYFGVY